MSYVYRLTCNNELGFLWEETFSSLKKAKDCAKIVMKSKRGGWSNEYQWNKVENIWTCETTFYVFEIEKKESE